MLNLIYLDHNFPVAIFGVPLIYYILPLQLFSLIQLLINIYQMNRVLFDLYQDYKSNTIKK